MLDKEWDGWGWHLAIAWEKSTIEDSWYILEARQDGVEINLYPTLFLKSQTRMYQWLDKQPTKKQLKSFLGTHLGNKYDVTIYFWTSFQYLIRHFFNHRIPRLLDNRYTCWELVFEFCEAMGKPISSIYDCPIIADAVKVFWGKEYVPGK